MGNGYFGRQVGGRGRCGNGRPYGPPAELQAYAVGLRCGPTLWAARPDRPSGAGRSRFAGLGWGSRFSGLGSWVSVNVWPLPERVADWTDAALMSGALRPE